MKDLFKMSKTEFDELMYEKFPKIFVEHTLPMTQTCMCWGLDIGPGWRPLVLSLCDFLQNTDHNNYPQVIATQVKEKFGGLRFYFDIQFPPGDHEGKGYEYIDGAVDFAESMSLSICEECGTTQGVEQRDNGWIVTLCEGCYKKKLRK